MQDNCKFILMLNWGFGEVFLQFYIMCRNLREWMGVEPTVACHAADHQF